MFFRCSLLLIMIFVSGCAVPLASGPAETYNLDFTPPQGTTAGGAFVFIVDGVSAEVFNEMLAAGKLPAIKSYFIDRGLYIPNAIASSPSITLANLTALTTGCWPGNNNIPAITWFDRHSLIWRNYSTIDQKNMLDDDHSQPTIFEQFPDDFTVSVFYQSHRGADKFFENWTSAGPAYFFGMYDYVDRLTLYRLGEMMQLAAKRKQFPKLVYIYLLMPDFMAYENGVSSRYYREALEHTDKQIGRVLGDMKRDGVLDKVYIAFTSDHSMCEVRRHFSLEEFLDEKCGLNVASRKLWEQTKSADRKKYYDKFQCVTYGNGDRFWALSFRKPQGNGWAPWKVRPTAAELVAYPNCSGKKVNLIDKLIDLSEVDAVAWKSGKDKFRMKLSGGEVEFTQLSDSKVLYEVIHGTDPLGWRRFGVSSGQAFTAHQWAAATYQSRYPCVAADLLAYFDSSRRGDIAVFAAKGYDFGWKNRAGHGAITPGDLLVPLTIAGPGVPHKKLKTARTVDLVPTLLELLGKAGAMKTDGVSLVNRVDN